LELDDAVEVTRDAVRAAFRKLALRVHPDKNPGYGCVCVWVCSLQRTIVSLIRRPARRMLRSDAAAEERFRKVTLACAVLVAEAEAKEGGEAAAGVSHDFDYDEWNAAYQTPQLAQILKLAVSGMDPHEVRETHNGLDHIVHPRRSHAHAAGDVGM
jgi:curved DNA-binding protein CbpA